MPIAKRMGEYNERSSWIRAMFEAGTKLKAEFGAENVYDFSLGNPYPEPPESFYQSLAKHAADHTPGAHGYMPNAGYPEVRNQVAAFLNKNTGMELTADHVIMTVGAAGALNIVFKALLDPGAEVVVPAPYFVEYDFYAENYGGKVVSVPCKEDFALDLDAIAAAITDKTYAVLINSPNNPSGAVYGKQELDGLADILTKAGEKNGRPIYLISDEPYRKIVFDDIDVPYIFNSYPHSIVGTSFSKDLSLAGERLGYAAVNPAMADCKLVVGAMVLANRIMGYVNAPGLMQKVVAELLEDSSDLSLYTKKRDMICQVLDDAGFKYFKPKGAFYVFAKAPISDDVQFVRKAQEENILVVPGSGFKGPGHFRIAFCCDDAVIERSAPAFKRLAGKF